MKFFFNWKSGFLLVLGCSVIAGVSFTYLLFLIGNTTAHQLQSRSILPTPPLASILRTKTTGTSSLKPCSLKQRDFQMGIAFPQWSPTGYGGNDTNWLTELPEIRTQIAACWVEMPILFSQPTLASTVVTTGPSTPSILAFAYGIKYAHALGLHVFVTALLNVNGPQTWAGSIQLSTYEQEQQWFTNYWQVLKPYMKTAAQNGVEQFALGTEEEWLQENAPVTLWNTLIANAHSIFSGALTYDVNWTSLQKPIPTWMNNTDLKMIGVSAYLPLIDSPERVEVQQMSNLWATTAMPELDAYAEALGKPIFISEVGYRNSADALYQPWVASSSAPIDPQEQAGAYNAALTNILPDQHILGSFFWGWDNVGAFNLKNSLAATIIRGQYKSLQH